MKKSQKVASGLIQRNDKEKQPTGFHSLVNSVGAAKLESDLMAQWRSLFLGMGDILAHESNHLVSAFTSFLICSLNAKCFFFFNPVAFAAHEPEFSSVCVCLCNSNPAAK